MGYKTIIEDDIDVLIAGAGLGGPVPHLKQDIGARTRRLLLPKKPTSIVPVQ